MRLHPLVVCVALGAAACSGGHSAAASPPPTLAGDRVVRVADFVFSPEAVTVSTGATVIWDFHQKDAPHNVVSLDGPASFNSGAPQGSGTFRFTFTVPGTYVYDCEVHPYMRGTVNVTP